MVDLYEHQEKALGNLDNGKVLHGGVGTGKSLTAIAYYVRRESPKDVVIITTAQKRDKMEWDAEAAKFGLGKHKGGTLHGQLTVDSWNNIGKYVDREDCFFILDEQRLVGSGAWVKAFYKIAKRNRWILLSATPGDDWLDYAPLFIANGLFKNITEFKYHHCVYRQLRPFPMLSHYIDVETLERYRNMLLVEMPYDTGNTRHIVDVQLEYDEDLFKRIYKDRWHIYEDRPLTDVGEMFRVMRKLSATDPSRVNKLLELMGSHPKLIIFYQFNYELDLLREVCGETDATIGEWNGHKKTPIPDTDKWVYLVQYTSGAEGWNCTLTDAMIFWSLPYSYKIFEQAHGRIDRLDNVFKDLYYYYFGTRSVADRRVREAIERKEIFNESKFAVKELGISAEIFATPTDEKTSILEAKYSEGV